MLTVATAIAQLSRLQVHISLFLCLVALSFPVCSSTRNWPADTKSSKTALARMHARLHARCRSLARSCIDCLCFIDRSSHDFKIVPNFFSTQIFCKSLYAIYAYAQAQA